MTPEQQTRTIEATDEIQSTTQQLVEARKNAKAWGELADQLRDQLLEEMDDALVAVTASGEPVVKISESNRKSFDKKRFASDHPEIDLGDYDKITLVRQVLPQ